MGTVMVTEIPNHLATLMVNPNLLATLTEILKNLNMGTVMAMIMDHRKSFNKLQKNTCKEK